MKDLRISIIKQKNMALILQILVIIALIGF